MQVRKIVLGFVAVSMLAGCSSFTESRQVDYKAGAVRAKPLEAPPDLIAPETDQRYTIPGTDGEQAASYSEYSKQKTEQPCIAPEAAPAAKTASVPAARLLEHDGVKSILIAEPFDRSWRKIGLALDRARIKVKDKDRSKGTYFVPVVAESDKDKTSDYQVVVRETRAGSETSVVKADGKGDAAAAKLLETLFRNLEEKAPAP
jgi:outer membrane protein assembly factor BamC